MGHKSDLCIRIGGEGGEGIISSGDILAQAAAKAGLEVLTFKTFPAEIRGGYAMYQIRMSSEKILSEGDGFQVLVVFNKEALDNNINKLKAGNVLIWDGPEGGDINELPEVPEGVIVYNLPMSKLAKVDLGVYRSKNMVCMGALSELFNIPVDRLKEIINNRFGKKGQDIVDLNYKALQLGIDYVKENHQGISNPYNVVAQEQNKDVIIMSGNDAVGLGALMAGCNFFACYPITPATEIAYWVAKHLVKKGGTVVQTEDEISSIGAVVGASFAGAKAMTGTSGPGLSLMTEILGLGVMVEAPLVICDVQRGGPSTGLPTKHEQSDLFLACYGGHGDFPRIVLSAENVADCVDLTIHAFNLAEHYQTPVILLTDGSLGFRTETFEAPDINKVKVVNRKMYNPDTDGEFLRYKFTEDNISPTAIPGMEGCAHMQTGLEHNEKGSPNYGPVFHTKNTEKRFNKIANAEDFFESSHSDIEEGATVGVVTWGSTQGSVREAVQQAREAGVKVSAFYPKLVWPFPMKAFNEFLKTVDKILVPEVNYQGQLAEIIKTKEIGKEIIKYNIYGGLPFEPQEIAKKIKEVQ
ncbi:MAG: 2-oxoacid:acceptor oxidoreductase subunit alpha [Nitrospinae bacterium]|nr:2-oxoacid:acceptor oxidoreductase subunit alpha [Nitrospinota bacterium]